MEEDRRVEAKPYARSYRRWRIRRRQRTPKILERIAARTLGGVEEEEAMTRAGASADGNAGNRDTARCKLEDDHHRPRTR